MGGCDFVGAAGQLDQFIRQPHIDPLEGDLVYHQEQISDALGKGGKHEITKRFGARDQIVERLTSRWGEPQHLR